MCLVYGVPGRRSARTVLTCLNKHSATCSAVLEANGTGVQSAVLLKHAACKYATAYIRINWVSFISYYIYLHLRTSVQLYKNC